VGNRLSPAVASLFVAVAGLLLVYATWHQPRAEADDPAPSAAKPAAKPRADGKDEPPDEDEDDLTNPLGANAACYVCHMTFVREELSKVHLAAKVGCIKCHGLSAGHANDEDIGATKPDVTFQHDQVDKMCGECHDEHDVSARKVVARFLQRKLAPKTTACTDCHGTHKIERSAEDAQQAGDGAAPKG